MNEEQFKEIVNNFQYGSSHNSGKRKIKQLALNILSVPVKQGLYVLAYRRMNLDVKGKCLRPAEEITVCTEFTIDGVQQSIRKFLDADDYELLNDFEKNEELIKDRITEGNSHIKGVDDMPYLIAIGRDVLLDLNEEYKAIDEMIQTGEVTAPIQAFFGIWCRNRQAGKCIPLLY